jgi:chromosome segregation ATPase
MDPETVVEQIQEQAASEAESQVTAIAHEVSAEVEHVSEQVSEHAEQSEQRHEEILGETSWLEKRTAELQMGITELRSSLLQMRETQSTILERVSQTADLNREISSQVSHLSNRPALEAERTPEVEPADAVDDHLEAATEPLTPSADNPIPKRKVKI